MHDNRKSSPSVSLLLLQHGQNISSGIFEPGDGCGTGITAVNTLIVSFDLASVTLKTDAAVREFIDDCFDIVNREIKNRKSCRRVIRLGIDEHPAAAGKFQRQP